MISKEAEPRITQTKTTITRRRAKRRALSSCQIFACSFAFISCCGWRLLFALGVLIVVADICWLAFHLGLLLIDVFFAHFLFFQGVVFSLGDPRWPTYTHPPTLQRAKVLRWPASLHTELLGGGWCWLGDVQRSPLWKWLHFGDPGKSNNMLPFKFWS